MNNNNSSESFLTECYKYSVKTDKMTAVEALTILTDAYMDQCGLSLTYRTLIEAAGFYWMDILKESDHLLAEKARNHSFTGIMPDLSEEFNARKEHYWEYDVCCLDSEDVIAAIPGIMDEYSHDKQFKIAFCAGIIPYIEWLKDYEITRDEILGNMK